MRHGDASLVTGKARSLPLAEAVRFRVSKHCVEIGCPAAVIPVALVTLNVTGLLQLGYGALYCAVIQIPDQPLHRLVVGREAAEERHCA